MYSNIWFISGNRNCFVIIQNPCIIGVITKRSIIHRISPKTKDLFEWASGVIKTVYEMKIPDVAPEMFQAMAIGVFVGVGYSLVNRI